MSTRRGRSGRSSTRIASVYFSIWASVHGKTVITMTAIEELMHNRFEVDRVLVIAPKRVAEDTWTREAAKWDHLQDLRISPVLGSVKERTAALEAEKQKLSDAVSVLTHDRDDLKGDLDSAEEKLELSEQEREKMQEMPRSRRTSWISRRICA